MRKYVFTSTCEVCGGEGSANASISAASWLVNEAVVHSDPRACAQYLLRKRTMLDKRERELQDPRFLARAFFRAVWSRFSGVLKKIIPLKSVEVH